VAHVLDQPLGPMSRRPHIYPRRSLIKPHPDERLVILSTLSEFQTAIEAGHDVFAILGPAAEFVGDVNSAAQAALEEGDNLTHFGASPDHILLETRPSLTFELPLVQDWTKPTAEQARYRTTLSYNQVLRRAALARNFLVLDVDRALARQGLDDSGLPRNPDFLYDEIVAILRDLQVIGE